MRSAQQSECAAFAQFAAIEHNSSGRSIIQLIATSETD
jgi:hypothetical protein